MSNLPHTFLVAAILLLAATLAVGSAAFAQDAPPVLGESGSNAPLPAPPAMDAASDSSREAEEDADTRSLAAWSRKVPVSVWTPMEPARFSVRLSDSLMRWEPVATFAKSLDRTGTPVRSFGFGTSGRTDALYLMADDPWHLRLTLEGLELNDPITGQPDLNRLSRRRTSVLLLGRGGSAAAELTAFDRVHHLTEPRMYLHFSEAGSTLRNLDVLYSHNVLSNMNVEIGYHDQRDGLEYAGMKVEGGSLHIRSWVQLNGTTRIRMGWQSQKREAEEPFGYTSGQLSLFAFDPLTARPLVAGVKGVKQTSDRFLQVEIRPSHGASSSLAAGFHDQRFSRTLSFQSDPVDASVKRRELFARHVLHANPLDLRSEFRLRAERLGGPSLEGGNRSGASAAGTTHLQAVLASTLGLQPVDGIMIQAGGSVTRAQDQAHSHVIHAGAELEIGPSAGLFIDASRQSLAPTYQMRYWSSGSFKGEPDLDPEVSTRAGMGIDVFIRDMLRIGAGVEWRRTESTPWNDPLGQASSSGAYDVKSAHASISLESAWLETGVDALLRSHAAVDLPSSGSGGLASGAIVAASADPFVQRLADAGPQLLIRGSAFVKGPVFSQAAFVKAGFVLRLSPLAVQGPGYDPVLDRWEAASDPRELPSYLAVDARMSTRLRWMMLHLELENMLEGLGQAGYFSAPGYPMPGRRWVFGLQVLFRN